MASIQDLVIPLIVRRVSLLPVLAGYRSLCAIVFFNVMPLLLVIGALNATVQALKSSAISTLPAPTKTEVAIFQTFYNTLGMVYSMRNNTHKCINLQCVGRKYQVVNPIALVRINNYCMHIWRPRP